MHLYYEPKVIRLFIAGMASTKLIILQGISDSQQGINPRNFIDDTQTRLPVKATATYNATNIKRSDFLDAEKIKYTLKLYKKTDDNGEVEYTEVNDISNYIDLADSNSVFIKVNSGVTSTYANGAKMEKVGNQLVYIADM